MCVIPFTFPIYVLGVFISTWHKKKTYVGVLLLSGARLLRMAVCCSCHRTKSLAHAMCEMRLWLWLPVASHQLLSSLDILLSPTLSSKHPSSSGWNHPSENTTFMESQGSAPVQRQTREEMTDRSQMRDCRIVSAFPVFSLKESLNTFPLPNHFPPSETLNEDEKPIVLW